MDTKKWCIMMEHYLCSSVSVVLAVRGWNAAMLGTGKSYKMNDDNAAFAGGGGGLSSSGRTDSSTGGNSCFRFSVFSSFTI